MHWAVEQRTGSATRKAVLMALADRHNKDTGRCDPHMKRVAEDTELSLRSVERATADLVEQGLLARSRKRRADGSWSGYVYAFPHVSVSEPADGVAGGPPDPVSGQEPEVDLEPGSSTANAVDSLAAVRERTAGETVWKVDRKPVKWEHAQLAMEILAMWNHLTGQHLKARTWLAKIVMRIREYPEATLSDHRYLIERNLAHPWWKGAPTPSVIYGSDAQFERSVMTARHEEADSDRIERIVNAVMERGAA